MITQCYFNIRIVSGLFDFPVLNKNANVKE